MKFALHSTRVILPEGSMDATIFIDDERISGIAKGKVNKDNFLLEDFQNDVIMPGLIDSHVHINEPGRTHWEGFDSATKSAAAGGITTLIDMPLNSSPVTTSLEAFKIKLASTRKNIHVNCGFWGGYVPESLGSLESLVQSGVMGIKVFLCHSGIDEFPNVTEKDLRKAMSILKTADVPLLIHCELVSEHPYQLLLKKSASSYQAFLKSRPPYWEYDAISMVIRLCEEFDVACHIVHLSSAECLPLIIKSKKSGLPLTVETCPHYLVFESENIPDGATEYKCAPPIRDHDNNSLLWKAIRDQWIDFVVTDHSPAPPHLKEIESGNFEKAWGGIASLQFSLSAVWTRARVEGINIEEISKLMSLNVAKFLKIDHERGKIAKGYMADLMVWSPEESFILKENMINHKHKITPYLNKELKGVVKKTYVSGTKVYDNGTFPVRNMGTVLLKPSL